MIRRDLKKQQHHQPLFTVTYRHYSLKSKQKNVKQKINNNNNYTINTKPLPAQRRDLSWRWWKLRATRRSWNGSETTAFHRCILPCAEGCFFIRNERKEEKRMKKGKNGSESVEERGSRHNSPAAHVNIPARCEEESLFPRRRPMPRERVP